MGTVQRQASWVHPFSRAVRPRLPAVLVRGWQISGTHLLGAQGDRGNTVGLRVPAPTEGPAVPVLSHTPADTPVPQQLTHPRLHRQGLPGSCQVSAKWSPHPQPQTIQVTAVRGAVVVRLPGTQVWPLAPVLWRP